MTANATHFTCNMARFLKHTDRLHAFSQGHTTPPHIVILPNTQCQLNCPHCCYKGKPKDETIDFGTFRKCIERVRPLGVEIAGGGDPLLWGALKLALQFCKQLGIKTGIMTNGLAIEDWDEDTLAMLQWMRLNLNVLDVDREAKIRCIPDVVISGCYIIAQHTKLVDLARAMDYANEHKLPTRIALDAINIPVNEASYLAPNRCENSEYCFFTPLVPQGTPACYMVYWKPCLAWDGYIYPCPSIALDQVSGATVQEKHRVCRGEDFAEWLKQPVHDLPHHCVYCKYTEINQLLHGVREDVQHPFFV